MIESNNDPATDMANTTEPADAVDVFDVAVIGAGIVGLSNALQLAKRGMRVVLLDNVRDQKRSHKVGESFLVFTSTFLRTIGGLDDFVSNESFIKLGSGSPAAWSTGRTSREPLSGR